MNSEDGCLYCGNKVRPNDDFCSDECADKWLEKEASKKQKKNRGLTVIIYGLITATIGLTVFFYDHFHNIHSMK